MATLLSILVLALPSSGEGRAPAPTRPANQEVSHGRVREDRRWRAVSPFNRKLNRMAQCESTGRWFIATGNGFYGGLQFDAQTWHSVGGSGLPHQNSILEQKFRAVLLIRRRGYAPWPICGYA